jgi:asparagine synthase (glutamine-hydrolysing)
MAGAVGARSHLVFPTPDDFWSDFLRLAWHQDMPFGALSFYVQWRVMRAASEAGVKVLLDGQGGDEVFGGYAKFRYAYVLSLLRSGQVATFSREIAGMLRHGDRYFLDLRNGFRYLPASLRRALKVDSILQEVVTGDWDAALADESTPATRWWRNVGQNGNGSGWSVMQQIQVDDITVDTLPQLLRMEDRSSMAFSLEARVPCSTTGWSMRPALPDRLRDQGFSKFAVRQAMAGVLPETVDSAPQTGVCRTGSRLAGRPAAWPDTELLSGELLSTIHRRPARAVGTCSRADRASAARIGLFGILSLEMWMRAFNLANDDVAFR